MAWLRSVVAPLSNYLHNPLPVGPGICQVCRGPVEARYDTCYACKRHLGVRDARLADAVVPIAYAIDGEQHYADLVSYKSARPGPLAASRLSTITELFIREHLSCIRTVIGAAGLHVAVVPSTRGRTGSHPLTGLLKLSANAPLVTMTATRRYPSEHREFAADRFVVESPVTGWRGGVLVFDDTWVTGARVQSAAHTLRTAGAPTVVAVVLGRRVTDNWAPAEPLLARARAVRYDTATCGLCRT